MIGRLKLSKGGSGGVNGQLATYTVETGNSVVAGDFVKLITSTTIARAIQGDEVLGIASQNGSSGSSIKVYIREVSS